MTVHHLGPGKQLRAKRHRTQSTRNYRTRGSLIPCYTEELGGQRLRVYSIEKCRIARNWEPEKLDTAIRQNLEVLGYGE